MRIGTFVTFLILFMGIFVNSHSETKLKELNFTLDTLDNGLTVIYHIDKSAPITSTVMYYKVGSKDEPEGKTGYAHFFEHLMFEATSQIKRGEMDLFTQEAAGNLNAFTSFDETVYFVKVPSNYVKLPLWIESQRMRQLKIESLGVETQRGVVIEEKKQRYDNAPYGSMITKMMSNIFPENYYSWTPIGDLEHLNAATIQDFKDFYNTYYTPNNAILVISGDINVFELKKVVKAYFSSYKPSKNITRRDSIVPLNLNPIDEKVLDKHATMPAIFMGYRAIPYFSKDYFAMELLMDILSTGESSRLYKKLVLDEKLALESTINFMPLQMSGAAIFNIVANNESNIDEIRDIVDAEIKKIATSGVKDEELQRVKTSVESDIVFKRADLLETSIDIARAYVYHGSPAFLNKEIEKYQAVTKEDIQRVAKEYLLGKDRVILTYIPDNNN